MDSNQLIQKLFRILFYVLMVLTITLYLLDRQKYYPNTYWMQCGLGAIGISLVRFIMRFM